jgi:hypothetical protein
MAQADRRDRQHTAARRRDQRNRGEFALRRELRRIDGEVARLEADGAAFDDNFEATKRMIAHELRRERWGKGPFEAHPSK